MKSGIHQTHTLLAALLSAAALLTGCQTTSVKSTWKAPDASASPVRKVALVAVADQGLVRGGFENRFVTALAGNGQPAFATYEMIGLQDIKADKDAAAARFRAAGADSILIVRLVNSATRASEVRESRELNVPVTTGVYSDGWYDWYSVAFVDMSTVRSSTRQDVFLESRLFDLATGKRLWTCTTDTVVKDDVDRLVVVDAFVAKIVAALRKDGLVR